MAKNEFTLKITKEIKTAILVIASVLLFIWGYSFLKGKDLLSSYKVYYVQYDNVEGLINSSPVTINGLVVGKVNDIHFLDKSGKLQVELQVKSDFMFSKSSTAVIYEPGLIGGKQIMIVPNFQDNSVAESGSILQGGVKSGLTDLVAKKLTPLQEKVEDMTVAAKNVLNNLNEILDSNTKSNIKRTIANMDVVISELKELSKNSNELVSENKSKLNSMITNLDNTSSNFNKISDSLEKAKIGETIATLQKALDNANELLNNINSGKGTLGKLSKEDSLYNNLTNSTKELELLLQDLRLNPTRYVNVSLFGKKNKPYKAPVNDTISK